MAQTWKTKQNFLIGLVSHAKACHKLYILHSWHNQLLELKVLKAILLINSSLKSCSMWLAIVVYLSISIYFSLCTYAMETAELFVHELSVLSI